MPRPAPKPSDYDRVTGDDDAPAYEPTYRDGSAKNECWDSADT